MNGALRQQGTDSMPEMWTQCWQHHGDWYFDKTGGRTEIKYLGKLEAAPEGVKVYETNTTTFFASNDGRSTRDPDLTRLFGPGHPDVVAAAVRPRST